jgi:hypothetical protein
MASEEAMKEAKVLVDNFDGARQTEGEVAIATALDAARAAGRAEGLKEAARHCRERGQGLTYYQDPTHVARQAFRSEADAIDALATATQAGGNERREHGT